MSFLNVFVLGVFFLMGPQRAEAAPVTVCKISMQSERCTYRGYDPKCRTVNEGFATVHYDADAMNGEIDFRGHTYPIRCGQSSIPEVVNCRAASAQPSDVILVIGPDGIRQLNLHFSVYAAPGSAQCVALN